MIDNYEILLHCRGGFPDKEFKDYPKVILVHNQEGTANNVALKLVNNGFFPYLFPSSRGLIETWSSNFNNIKDSTAILIHKDIGGIGIEEVIKRLRDQGGELIRTFILSGEFFRSPIDERCMKFAQDLGIDGGYDPTGMFGDGPVPEWIVDLLKVGYLTPEELLLRGTKEGLIRNDIMAKEHIKKYRLEGRRGPDKERR